MIKCNKVEKVIGRYAYKKHGFFSHLLGKIEKNDNGISPYIIRFKDGGGTGFSKIDDIGLWDGANCSEDG